MITLKSKNSQGIVFSSTCDELVSIKSLVEHKANKVWRAISDKAILEERNILKESILANGLREPITMYKNSRIIISGHTRTSMLADLGCLEVPVIRLPRTPKMIKLFGEKSEIDPMHEDVIKEHAISNTRVNTSVFGRYGYAREIMAASIAGFESSIAAKGQISVAAKNRIVKQAGISTNTFDKIEGVRFGFNKLFKDKEYFVPPRLDLYSDLSNPNKDYSVNRVSDIQISDFKNTNFSSCYPKSSALDKVMKSLNMVNVIKAVDQQIAIMDAGASRSPYPGVNWLSATDDNFISAAIHHMVCAFACVELNIQLKKKRTNCVAVQGERQSHYDILIKDVNGEVVNTVEVKSTFGRSEWSSSSNKTGYALLIAYNKERTRYFAASTYLDSSDWSGGVKGKYTLKASSVHDTKNVTYYVGDIDVDNDVYRIQKHEI
jgi:hypothetical protein